MRVEKTLFREATIEVHKDTEISVINVPPAKDVKLEGSEAGS